MKTEIPELKTLQEAIKYFADPERSRLYFVAHRWPDGVTCPHCDSDNVAWQPKYNRWQCNVRHPRRQFTCKTGTIFEDSPLPLEKWMMAMWMLCNCKNGVSSYEIHRDIGVTQKSAWFMNHRIRLAMKNQSFLKLGSGGGPVEADETFIGPDPTRMHKKRKDKIKAMAFANRTTYRTAMNTIVFGMVDREMREVRTSVIPNVKRVTLQEHILNNITEGTQVMTDEMTSYQFALADKFVHGVVDHTKEYVRGAVHTQGIDNFWSLLKRMLRGTYIAVEPFHLDRYCDEQAFRYNRRGSKKEPIHDGQRFGMLLCNVTGKRIQYKELTGKDGASPAEPF